PCGEIGDICNADGGKAGPNDVQKEWSNKNNACIDNSDNKVTVADFSIALDKTMLNAPVGGTATATVTTTAVGTKTNMVNLAVTGLPMGVTAAFAPTSVMTTGSSMITFTIPAGTMMGSVPYTITGNTALPDNVIHSVDGTLNVTSPPPPDMA